MFNSREQTKSAPPIQIVPFKGKEVAKLIPEIAKLRIEVFAEYPFLYEGDLDYEKRYLNKFTEMEDSIAVAAFDGKKLVGVSTGYPFRCEDEALQKVFLDSGRNPDEYFCYGESVLLKPYRGQGLANAFYSEREKHVREMGRFSKICFFTSKRPEDDPRRPADYRPLDGLWKKWGFIKHDHLVGKVSYKEIGESAESPKEMVFWIKELT